MNQSQPPITGTSHTLPFDKLSPRDFERLCLWLVEREAYERAEHLGAAGSEQGRDIVAWREGALWAFQCKRVRSFGPKDALAEVEKVLALPEAERPVGLVFLVTCDVSVRTRRKARARCAGEMKCHFWAGTELDEKVKRHLDILEEFFQVAVPPPRPIPFQIPRRAVHFQGREQELAALLDHLRPGAAVTLCGPGGIGKTALAAEAIARLPEDRFPDGIIFHTFYRQPEATLALEHIARSYGLDPRPTLADAARMALAGKRALLVLDGTEEADDLGAVLACAGKCGVLVTSQRRGDAPDSAQRFDLHPLEETQSMALLQAWGGHRADDEEAARNICQLVGGLPLAIQLAGTYMARTDEEAADYLAWLETTPLAALDFGQKQYQSVPVLMEHSLKRVSERAQVALGLVGLMGFAPFRREAIASGLEIEERAAGRVLGELVDYGLLARQDGRYAVTHALVHTYARQRLSPGEEDRKRLAYHYLALTHEQCPRLSGPDYLKALTVLNADYPNIRAVWEGTVESENWELVQDFASALADYQNGRGLWKEMLTWAQEGLAACEHLNDRTGRADMQIVLGNAYSSLPTGNRAANLRRAIEYYCQALRVYTWETAPLDCARLHNNLGFAYAQLPIGDRTENLERAIEYYCRALHVCTLEAAPLDYARIHNNLGFAYAQRLRGDWAVNLESAIERYRQALQVCTPEAAPLDWARTQNNLGLAYTQRLMGDRAENLEIATKCYGLALRVYTLEATPLDWARTQNNQGFAYAQLPTEDRAENLERAIECYRQALQVCTPEAAPLDYATTQRNLGNAYRDLPTGDRGKNLERAIAYYEQALQFYTSEAAPWEYAATQNDFGVAYAELPTGERAANLAQAIHCYQDALRFYAPEAMPYDCRRVSRNLGNLLFGEGRWTEAHAAYTTALQAAEALYAAAFMEAGREAEISENATLYAHDAFCLAHLGQLKEALVQLEEGKTRTLAERLGRAATQLEKVKPEDQKAYRELLNRLKALEAEQGAGGDGRPLAGAGRPYTEIARDVGQAREELDALIRRTRDYLPDFLPAPSDFTTIKALVPDEQTALLEFCVTEKGSVVLVVRPEGEPEAVWIERFTQADLSRTVREWEVAYRSRDHTGWRATIERVLNEIGLRLVTPLHTVLQKYDISRLILIPQSSLFLLPLHAALISEDGAYLLDHYEVSYIPSVAVLQRCQERAAQARGKGLLAVVNPQKDPGLVFASFEGERIAGLFSKDQRVLLEEHEGTKKAVLQNVKGRGYLHFNCHGIYNWSDPLQSGLFLTDPDCLTLEDLQRPYLEFEDKGKKERVEVDMTAARLVTLSACETGITDATSSRADEYVGLPAAFMQAGVPCVVSSLWSLPALSTSLLMERFYVNHLRGDPDACGDSDENLKTGSPLSPSEALRRAQIWLRDEVTAQEAAERCDEQIDKLESKGQDVPTWLSRAWRKYAQMARKTPDSRPFAHPFHWAAFTVYGI